MKFQIEGENYTLEFSYETITNTHHHRVVSTIVSIFQEGNETPIAAANVVQKWDEPNNKEKARRYGLIKALNSAAFFSGEMQGIQGHTSRTYNEALGNLKSRRTAVWEAYNNRNNKVAVPVLEA